MILANSTQNDLITIITTYDTDVITEDVFFDFLSQERRINLNWSKEYIYDDLLHANDVYINNGNIYACMFYDYNSYDQDTREIENPKIRQKGTEPKLKEAFTKYRQNIINDWRKTKEKMKGAVYNITNRELIAKTTQPHTFIINQFGEQLFCESGTFRLFNITKNKYTQCKGFTRGLCEDTKRGGYWVGSSYHRIFSSLLPGAAIEFVNYDMKVEEIIDLSKLGLEIYDIIPYREGLPI
jgi:hypothetical protein